MGKEIDCEGCGVYWLVCSSDGVCKSLRGWNVPGKVPAGDFGFAKKFEEDVWGEWERAWVVLF